MSCKERLIFFCDPRYSLYRDASQLNYAMWMGSLSVNYQLDYNPFCFAFAGFGKKTLW
jgi:hypothetical protein